MLLNKLKDEKNLSEEGEKALEEAVAVADGLDPYLEKISTPHPDILVGQLSCASIHAEALCFRTQ